MRILVLAGMLLAGVSRLWAGLSAENFAGTNSANTYSEFALTVGADVTNLSLTLPGNSAAFSYLMLRKGAAPSDSVYDFSSRLDGQTNAVHLEMPELSSGTYYLRVRTPANSGTHAFNLRAEANRLDLRSAEKPVSKPLGAVLAAVVPNNQWHHFRIEPRTNLIWRASVDATNTTSPDLYIQSGKVPAAGSYYDRSVSQTNDVVTVNGTAGGGAYWYVSVLGVGGPPLGTLYTLRIQAITPKDLAWDPGETHTGTQVYTNQTTAAGDYYFRVRTGNPSLGAWRTALRLFTTNDASLYLSKGKLPTVTSAAYKLERPGSKGIVLALGAQFNASEEWFLLVRAKAGSQWSLMSGDPFVQNLGLVATNTSSSSGQVEIGPEGIRFFSASAPSEMLAWRLWLNGATNSIFLKTNRVPLPPMQGAPTFAGSFELNQPAQMLVVPPYLGVRQYFIGVPGTPGTKITLDNRQQPIIDLPYEGSVTQHVTGFGFSTYRVSVPFDQFAWQLYLSPTNGNANLAVRREEVPNENWNNAVSELPGNAPDYLTLVPPVLSDGTFYVTVYSTNVVTTNNYRFVLESRPAPLRTIAYTGSVTNDEPTRVGWKFFMVHDDKGQLSSLGWDLMLKSHAPGTRIALRRSMAPSFWKFRNPTPGQTNCYEILSAKEFLQNPDQTAGTWYIGIFNPTEPLGPFVLTTRELEARLVQNNVPVRCENVLPGRWEFFRVQLNPEDLLDNAPGGPVLGLDLRVMDVTSGNPTVVIRRERLPYSLASTNFSHTATNWPTGAQWVATEDWTDRVLNPDQINESGRILAMGRGRPLVPATYYVGVLDKVGTNNASYTFLSRWIGKERAIPVEDLPPSGGRVTGTVKPREAKYYRVQIPPQTPSFRARLTMDVGEAMLMVTTNWIPTVFSDKKMQKLDKEHYLLLPWNGAQYLIAGTYYITVVGEGITPLDMRTIGAGETSFTLETLSPLPILDLGQVAPGADLTISGTLEGGTVAAYKYSSTPTSLGAWITLSDKLGNPRIITAGGAMPAPLEADPYGNEGGLLGPSRSSPELITAFGPRQDCIVLVKASGSGQDYPEASYTLNIKEIVPDPLPFDGGVVDVIGRPSNYDSYYYVDVGQEAQGWDLRFTKVDAGFPQLAVGRDALPNLSDPAFGSAFVSSAWPVGAYVSCLFLDDWTDRWASPDGMDESGRVVVFSRNRPLQPGRYYVRVSNLNNDPVSYSLQSRGIGNGMSIPIQPLEFANGQARVNDLPAREAVYYSVNVPPGARSWKVQLSATTGESTLMVLKDTIPNVAPTISGSTLSSGGRKMQKTGDEHFILLPSAGQTTLSGGTYYIAVASEGNDTTNSWRIGYGASSFTLTSLGEAPEFELGTVSSSPIVRTQSLAGGESRIYKFRVPEGIQHLEVTLDNRIGDPVVALSLGDTPPTAGAACPPSSPDSYGNEGGVNPGVNIKRTALTVANPTNGLYTLVVKARGSGVESPGLTIPDASYVLRISANGTVPLEFDGGVFAVTSHQAASPMRYFVVNVPTNAGGWDLRLTNVDSRSQPRLVVRRDKLPDNASTTSGWNEPGKTSKWPTNSQWAPLTDWTKRSFSAVGTNEDGRILAIGMNRPLEAGTYYIGVTNASSFPSSYTIVSRGIGEGFSIPILDLAYNGGSAEGVLSPREAAYYRLVVPSNAPSWKVQLTNTLGENMLAVYRSFLPNCDTVSSNGIVETGKGMQRSGAEQFLLLPYDGFVSIPPGTNYLAVVGEGRTPSAANRIGTDTSAYRLTSLGPLPITTLGAISSEDLVKQDRLMGGEVKAYRFSVPPKTYGFRVLLEEREGNPVVIVSQGEKLPNPGLAVAGLPADPYGNEGGYTSTNGHNTIFTMANPANSPYTMVIKARPLAGVPQNASYTLRIQEVLAPELNFASDLNTNGLYSEVSGLLQDNERAFFKVEVPEAINGQPVIGWKLELTQTSGKALMRVAREALPSDLASTNQMPFTSATAIIAPPYLTNGIWFVEVKAIGSTYFRLVSKALELERPAWTMPLPGHPSETPGVLEPEFADTAVDTNGTPSSAEGILLEQGAMHYYAVHVPDGNLGLLRAELRPINGQPVLYLREGAVPTLFHNASGAPGFIFDRALSARTNTAYVNWVPLNGRWDHQLSPGTYYIGVKAGGNSHALYRLKLSLGNITSIDLSGKSLTNQVLAADDWAYYRVDVPTALPVAFKINFSQEYGDVVMHLRDSIPPGNGPTNTLIVDWQDDAKNIGQTYPSYNDPGTYSFSSPPVRPGQPLYIGFRAQSQANFSVQVAADPVPTSEPVLLGFYHGTFTTNLQPLASAVIRVDVPHEATRWRHFSQHPTNIQVYLEQGALPTRSNYRWRSTSGNGAPLANSTNNTPLANWMDASKAYVSTNWPWVPSNPYYLLITNSSQSSQDFTIQMDGRNALLQTQEWDDNDFNTLPDVWELTYFGSTGVVPGLDKDNDRVSNEDEYLEGTSPVDSADFRARVLAGPSAGGGQVFLEPFANSYPLGSTVVLTAVPEPGYSFVGWEDGASGIANPLVIEVLGHSAIYARFKGAGDDFASALPLFGTYASVQATNIGFTKEPGEPFHAGNPGGKSVWWNWTAPQSGPVAISTAGSTFNTLLAVYTGPNVAELTLQASDFNSLGGTNRSRVTFDATSGKIYRIAVDGFNGASARIAMTLSQSGATQPPRLSNATLSQGGGITFRLAAPAGKNYIIECSEDMIEWRSLKTVTTSSEGSVTILDVPPAGTRARYYRVKP